MKRVAWLLILVLILTVAMPVFAGEGNSAPSGSHFTLNLIGAKDTKNINMDNQGGSVIFVKLGTKTGLPASTKINLTEGDFQVLDKNGTDGTAAFQLPNPDPDNNGITEYSVFARALGKPGGHSEMRTGATYIDPDTGEELAIMSVISAKFNRTEGKQTFTNVSAELLYIYCDYDGDGTQERVNLFSDELEDYFWQYDNNGLKIVQLRFYPISTVVPDPPVAPN